MMLKVCSTRLSCSIRRRLLLLLLLLTFTLRLETSENNNSGETATQAANAIEAMIANEASKLVAESLLASKLRAEGALATTTTTSDGEFRCNVCNIKLLSADQLSAHLVGKKHLKKLNSMSLGNTGSASASTMSSSNIKSKKLNGRNALSSIFSFLFVALKIIDLMMMIKTDDDKKFDHLNIAWSKYVIDDEMRKATDGKYEFYCTLCKKYIQRKLQLVDVITLYFIISKIVYKRKHFLFILLLLLVFSTTTHSI